MKLCKDCAHFQDRLFAGQKSICAHPENMEREPIYGYLIQKDAELADPNHQRRQGKCGIEATMFKQLADPLEKEQG